MMTRFKQLVRSAKCVVLSALAATALGSTAFGDNSRVTAKSYVQKNLIAHWDGVNNDGKDKDGNFKAHDASATSWTDLVANRPFTLTNSSGKWNDTYLDFSGKTTYGLLSATDTTATFGKIAANGVYEAAIYAPKKGESEYWIILKSTADVAHMVGKSYNYMRNTRTYPRDLTPKLKDGALTATVAAKYCSATANDYVGYTNGTRKEQIGSEDNNGGYVVGGTILGCRSSSSSTSSVTVQYPFPGKIYAVRLYDRQLSDDEIKVNSAIDKVRFYGETADISTLLPTGWDIGDDGLLGHRFKDGSTLTAGTAYDDYNVQFDADATVAVSALPEGDAAALTVTGKKAVLNGGLTFTLPVEGLVSGTYTLVKAEEVVIPAGAVVTVSSASETFTCTPSVTATEIKVTVTLGSSEAVTARIVEGQFVYFDADGNKTTAPQGGMNDKITILFSSDAEYRVLADNLETVKKAKGVVLDDDVVLTADADWSAFDFEKNGHVIDLKGHKLTVATLTGDATITDTNLGDYELLDYIYGDVSQYINTKYVLKANDIIDARMYIPTQGRIGMLLGCSSTGKNYYLSPCNGLPNYFRWKRGDTLVSNDPANPAFSKAYDTIVDIRTSGDTFTWKNAAGDTGSLTATGAAIVDCDRSCYILGENDSDGNAYCSAGRIYSFTITSGGTVVRQFIPARRKSDNELGLIDLVHVGSTDAANPEFYTRSGSGSFTAGAVTNTPAYGELHLSVASGEVTGGAKLMGSVMLVKDGAGTFKWNGGANSVATTCPVVITNGVFGFATDADNVFGNGGTITIAGKGQMDVSKKSANGDNTYSPVYNRTLYIEGDGPDDSGAITRNVSGGGWGYHLKVVNLTGDATIGGKSRVDFRGAGFKLNGAGHTLTVKNKALCVEDNNQGPITAKRIVVTDGGKFESCAGSGLASLQIAECIELTNGGKLMPWHRNASSAYSLGVPVTVGAGGGTIGTDQGKLSITKPVTVLSGSTATVSQTVTFKDVEVQGTLNATGTADITGTLSGGGTVSGADAKFSGTATRWTMAADAGGWTSKADLAGASTTALAALNAIDITYAGNVSKELEISPALGLTTTLPLLTVKTEDGSPIASTLKIEDGKLYVNINLEAVATATWTGAAGDDNITKPENWDCKNALGGTVADGLPGAGTTVTFAGDKVPSILTDSGFTAKDVVLSDASLSADCDWSGLTIPVSGTVDLKGHTLTVADLPSSWDVEITDSTKVYELLDYIYGDRSQYINTKYVLKANDIIDTRMYIPRNQNIIGMLLGCSSTGKNWYLSPCNGADCFRWKRGNTLVGDKQTVFPKAYDTIVDIRTSGDTFTWKNEAGDTGSLTATGAAIVDCDRPCYILGENDADGNAYCSAGRIYSFTITSGGTVVRQFIPARRKSDNELGLIDLAHVGSTDAANPEFYTRSGSGSFTAGAVTGAFGGGELHVNVASGATVENTSVTLSGSLKLVKEGEGTLLSMDATQTYTGGTDVLGGTVKLGGSSYLGTDYAPITVYEGAILDIGAMTRTKIRPVLAGGTLVSEETDSGADLAQNVVIVLTDDSSIDFTKNGGMIGVSYTPATLDLGGHELDLKVATGKSFWFDNVDVSAGLFKLSGGGTLAIDKTSLRAAEADFDIASKVTVAVPAEVHDWTVREGATVSGNGTITVNGTFRPDVDTAAKYALKAGSTLDLEGRSTALNAANLTFPEGTVYIDLGTRKAKSGPLISWEEGKGPANVTFKLSPNTVTRGILEVRKDGLYIQYGMMLIVR